MGMKRKPPGIEKLLNSSFYNLYHFLYQTIERQDRQTLRLPVLSSFMKRLFLKSDKFSRLSSSKSAMLQ